MNHKSYFNDILKYNGRAYYEYISFLTTHKDYNYYFAKYLPFHNDYPDNLKYRIIRIKINNEFYYYSSIIDAFDGVEDHCGSDFYPALQIAKKYMSLL